MNQTKLIMRGLSVGLTMLVACSQERSTETAPEKGEEVQQKEVVKPLNPEVAEKHEYLEVQLSNETGGLIEQASISFGANQCTFGMFKSGHSSTYLGWVKPVGTNAVVKWRDAQRIERKASLDFSKAYDPTIAGTLNFTITGTNVSVTFTKVDRRR